MYNGHLKGSPFELNLGLTCPVECNCKLIFIGSINLIVIILLNIKWTIGTERVYLLYENL
jgi:hypothetical protein